MKKINQEWKSENMKMYRFRLYPSKTQEKQMNTNFWLAKNLWNGLLEHSKTTYQNFDKKQEVVLGTRVAISPHYFPQLLEPFRKRK